MALAAVANAQGTTTRPTVPEPPGGEAAFRAAFARLDFVKGFWSGTPWQYRQGSPTSSEPRVAYDFRPVLGERYLEASGTRSGVDFRLTLSYNAVDKRYMMSLLDSGSGVLDVYAGDFDEGGRLVLENPHHFRAVLAPAAKGWQWIYEHSADGGGHWVTTSRIDFDRRISEVP